MRASCLASAGVLLAALGCEGPTDPYACLLTGTVTAASYQFVESPALTSYGQYAISFTMPSDTEAYMEIPTSFPTFLESNGTLYPWRASAIAAGDRVQVWTDGGAYFNGQITLPGRHCYGLTRVVIFAPGEID